MIPTGGKSRDFCGVLREKLYVAWDDAHLPHKQVRYPRRSVVTSLKSATCDWLSLCRWSNVVETVAKDSSRLNKRVSKLLNLKMLQEGAHLRPRQIPARFGNALFSSPSVPS